MRAWSGIMRAVVPICRSTWLPGLTPEDFAALTPKDRAWVNREGYRAYREWRMANADMVAQSEQEARQLLALR